MKVADLVGPQLDYWVARAEDCEGEVVMTISNSGKPACIIVDDECLVKDGWADPLYQRFAPSTDWSQGGPIIDRERILVGPRSYLKPDLGWGAVKAGIDREVEGRTPLIAAMRCYVASKFGKEVPDQQGA